MEKVPRQIGQVTQTEEKDPRKKKKQKKTGVITCLHSQESNKKKLEVIVYKWIYV